MNYTDLGLPIPIGTGPISNQNGTTAALTINTETFLGSDITSPGTYQLYLNVSNLALGDTLEIKAYTEVLSGDTPAVVMFRTLQNPTIEPIVFTPFFAIVNELKFSLKQTAGTGRTFKWNIIQIA
jgi:hypothetical protein